MLSQQIKLAWHFYRQSQTQQRMLSWIQGILLVFILTLSQTSANIQAYLSHNLANLLGADLVLIQAQALSDSQMAELAQMSAQVVLTQSLEITLSHQGQWQTASLKAVAEDYPLQGQLLSSSNLSGSDTTSSSGPALGEIWLDARLYTSLGLRMGETLSIGKAKLRVARILQHEPDRLMQGHSVQMRALVHREDMALFQRHADLIQYRYLVAASKQQVEHIRHWQQRVLPAAEVYHKQGAHPLALFWQRTENVLGLASIVLFFMAAIALQQLTRLQIKQEQFFTAVCQSLGASKRTGLQISVLKWLFGVLGLLPPALLLAALCHYMIVQYLADTFTGLTWQIQPLLASTTVAASVLIFIVFNLPLWLALRHASIRQLIHDSPHRLSRGLLLCCVLLVLAAVAAHYSDNVRLTAMVLVAMLSSIALLLLLSWLVLSCTERLSQRFSGLLPFALYMMKQRLMSKSTQILGIGLATFLLLFTLMLLKDLGSSMATYQRQHDGNVMVSQATQIQMADIKSWAARHQIAIRQDKPFMYAKLIRINGIALDQAGRPPSESLATLRKAIRMHWSVALPSNNTLHAGQWWQAGTEDWQQLSLEQEVMSDLGLQLGDRLSFAIDGQTVEFTITASHAYRAGAGSITFWVQVPPAVLHHVKAAVYNMASLELAPEQFALLGQLWQQHPSLRMVSLKELTARFDKILGLVTRVISGFALLISLLAAIVIIVSVHAVEAQERKKNSIIISFGLSRRTCLQLNMIEWIVTGSIAACGAIAGTWIAGALMYQSQFSLPYQPDFGWLLATLTLILCLVTALGSTVSKASLTGSIRHLMEE